MNTHHRLLAVLGILVLVLIASGLLMPAASRGASRPEVTLTPTAFAYLPHIAKAYPPPSADVALLLDISDSMASDTCGAGDYPCIHACDTATNVYNTDCHPFQEVKAAALQFLNSLSPGVDRVAVITFALQVGYCINPGDVWPDCLASAYDPANSKFGDKYVPLTLDLNAARTFITNLDIAIPEWAGDPPTYPIPPCPGYDAAHNWDPRQCTNTNMGGAMHASATELLKEFDPSYPGGGPNHPSKDHLRVIVLLTDGPPNASGLGAEGPDYGTGLQLGYCPQSTWYAPPPAGPFCRAAFPGLTIETGRHISTSVEYDAVDYLLDWSDFVLLNPPKGNGIVAYTIGLGNQMTSVTLGDPAIGEKVLRYIAAAGDDGNLATDPCSGVSVGQSCGQYSFALDASSLPDIVDDIAAHIQARLGR